MNTVSTIKLAKGLKGRQVFSLNGRWEIQASYIDSKLESIPETFTNTIAVPGLWDMADEPVLGSAAWYKKEFHIEGELPSVATLKISKAFWGKYIYLNGQHICDHHPNFTPACVDIAPYLQVGKNTLIIKIGAMGTQDNSLGHPVGYDKEKFEYIPGIYDDVSLILSENPVVQYIQVAPQPSLDVIKVQVTLQNHLEQAIVTDANIKIEEVLSTNQIATTIVAGIEIPANSTITKSVEITIPNAHLWSPEDPFLYKIDVETIGDNNSSRFGMRHFCFDKDSKIPMLNGKPYYLRGNNITMYRFFEDPNRAVLPWDLEWAREILQSFKDMNMNSIRYCIGFPPELWYELADELGFLIQDEYPIWYEVERMDTTIWREFAEDMNISYDPTDPLWWGIENLDGKYPVFGKNLPAIEETIIPELIDWINERANHPCVAIWDIQNETQTFLTYIMVKKIRELGVDLSNRPWDNGWCPPAAETDSIECHPYFFCDANFKMADINKQDKDPAPSMPHFFTFSRTSNPELTPNNPRIINEYAWLWIDRHGQPTALTRELYENLLPDATTEQRRVYYAKAVAKLTEFWRSGRKVAAVMYFCGLTYSKPRGLTSDAFLPDIANPSYHPAFKKYMTDAFAPLGICIEDWSEEYVTGVKDLVVSLYNDEGCRREGEVSLSLYRDEEVLSKSEQSYVVEAYGINQQSFEVEIPADKESSYRFVAAYIDSKGNQVCSVRDFKII